MLRASRLRSRLILQEESRQPNGQGGYTTAWTQVGDPIRAEIVGLSGDEALKAGIERSSQIWRITIRKREGITPKHRLSDGVTHYDIKSSIPDPQSPRDALLLICETGKAA